MADWLLVPCPGRRTHELLRLLDDLQHPALNVCVVTTDPDPVKPGDLGDKVGHLIHLSDEINYAKWLNAGMDLIQSEDKEARYVFITGSDSRCNALTIPTFTKSASERGLIMCGPDHWGMGDITFDPEIKRSLFYRVPPEYFLLDLRASLRFDEQFRWWFSEDDLEMQARKIGPIGLITDTYVEQPESPQGHVMSEQVERWSHEDRIKFVQKWGLDPW